MVSGHAKGPVHLNFRTCYAHDFASTNDAPRLGLPSTKRGGKI